MTFNALMIRFINEIVLTKEVITIIIAAKRSKLKFTTTDSELDMYSLNYK